MKKLTLDVGALHVESFRPVQANEEHVLAREADTLRVCGTNDWTCPFTG